MDNRFVIPEIIRMIIKSWIGISTSADSEWINMKVYKNTDKYMGEFHIN